MRMYRHAALHSRTRAPFNRAFFSSLSHAPSRISVPPLTKVAFAGTAGDASYFPISIPEPFTSSDLSPFHSRPVNTRSSGRNTSRETVMSPGHIQDELLARIADGTHLPSRRCGSWIRHRFRNRMTALRHTQHPL
jgi:hypothetical protein